MNAYLFITKNVKMNCTFINFRNYLNCDKQAEKIFEILKWLAAMKKP